MKIKKSFVLLIGMLFAFAIVLTINQPKQVSASVFQKLQYLRSSEALGMVMIIKRSSRLLRLPARKLC